MASRLRNFIHLRNIFKLNILNCDQVVSVSFQNARFYGTTVKSKFLSKAALVIGGLGLTGGAYGYLAAPDRKSYIAVPVTEKSDYKVNYEIPEIKPSRVIPGPFTDIDLDLTLYQYQNCPFCCKVRAFLDFYGIPYNVIEVNPVMRQQLKFSEYKKVPIVIAKNKKASVKHQLNDSSLIISILGTYLLDTNEKLENIFKYYVPFGYKDENGKKVQEVINAYFLMFGDKGTRGRTDAAVKKEREWRKWADSTLVHILSPNIYRTYDEALQAFKYFSEVGEWEKNFSTYERHFVIYAGATAMYFVGKRLKKRHSLKDDVRESLYDACNHWLKAVGKQKFMGGDVPNLADLAVYGLLNSIEGCMTFKELLQKTKIGPWYYNVKEAVTNHVGYKMIH